MVVNYLLAAGAGATVGYLVARKQMEKRYLEVIGQEIAEARADYEQRLLRRAAADEALSSYAPNSVEVEKEAKVVEQLITNPIIQEDLVKSVGAKKPSPPPLARVDYHKMSAPAETLAVVVPENPGGDEPEDVSDEVVPDIITMDEFIKNPLDYDQYSISYFAGDDILAGEEEEVLGLEMRDVTIGKMVMEMLKEGRTAMDGRDSLYIRNNEKRIELDITRTDGKYKDMVGPFEESG